MNIVNGLKQLSVAFQGNVDTSLFNQRIYSDISINGLHLTDLNLIHCASIHYQSRFSGNVARSFRYTVDTIEPSLQSRADHFYFNDNEEPELQKHSSEVIGVGFALALFQQLLDVNFNAFQRILPQRREKRCDFEIIKNGNRILLESKGRKTGLRKAINQILDQKEAYPQNSKYGCISIIPRNSGTSNNPVNITVVDPPVEPKRINRDQRILQLLIYYSRVSQLCGLYRLAFLLNTRIKEFTVYPEKIDRQKPLNYENILKFGRVLEVNISRKLKFNSFFSPDLTFGFKKTIDDEQIMFFGMDQSLVEILEQQDFDSLLDYNLATSDIVNDSLYASVHNDGTMLAVAPINKFSR